MIDRDNITKECKLLEASIKDKEKFISHSPSGKFQCRKSGKYYNWYISDKIINEGNEKTITKYINKNSRELAEKMAKKSLYSCEIRDEKKELRALKMYLKNCSNFNAREKFLSRSDGYLELLAPVLQCKWNKEIEDWLSTASISMAPYPENRKFPCKNGICVRSKSEQIIVSSLYSYDIPFKYEEPLELEGINIFPDFTIINQRTKDIFIWEHFGMMDIERYRQNSIDKINLYTRNGYIPFINILFTFETKDSGVDVNWIDTIIEKLLL